MTFLQHCFTGKDNTSGDLGRVLWAFFALALVGQQIWAGAHGQPFDPMTAAAAYGAFLASGGAALRIKAPTEPGGG